MAKSLFTLGNFRSWRGEQQVDLASLNLLFGGNSSGKSSIIHALALLKQSEPTKRLIPTGEEINLGRVIDQKNRLAAAKKSDHIDDMINFGLTINLTQSEVVSLSRANRLVRMSRRTDDSLTSRGNLIGRFSANLGTLFYREYYDDLGQIRHISLRSNEFDIINISLKPKTRTTDISCWVTPDKRFWELILDEKKTYEYPDEDEIERSPHELKRLEIRLSKVHQKIQMLNAEAGQIKRFSSTTADAKERLVPVYQSLDETMMERDYLRSRIADFQLQDQAMGILEGQARTLHSRMASALSFELTMKNDALEDADIVTWMGRLTTRYVYGSNLSEANFGNAAVTTLKKVRAAAEVLAKNSNDLVVNPFIILQFARGRFDNFTKKIERIGPHRERPDRISMVNPNQTFNRVGVNGENVNSVLKNISPKKVKELNHWFELLEIPYQVRKKFDKRYNIFQLLLLDSDENVISLSDVGYGIGQVLPIVLMCILRKNTIVTIEQPELHLHPKLQANLADLFIKSANENNNLFILETHSEHMVLRLKRRQREHKEGISNVAPTPDELRASYSEHRKQFSNRDSSSIFAFPMPTWESVRSSVVLSVVEMSEAPRVSKLTKITLNKSGEFDKVWPGDFFPERYIELGFED